MANWEISEGGENLDRIIELAKGEGPQMIVRDGAIVAVVLAMPDWRTAQKKAEPSELSVPQRSRLAKSRSKPKK